MACKECIHYDVCQYHITEETDMTVAECSHTFKNKADFVEVVRCKDCKHSREQDRVFGITDYKCSKHNISCLSPYDFCSYGERKKNDKE